MSITYLTEFDWPSAGEPTAESYLREWLHKHSYAEDPACAGVEGRSATFSMLEGRGEGSESRLFYIRDRFGDRDLLATVLVKPCSDHQRIWVEQRFANVSAATTPKLPQIPAFLELFTTPMSWDPSDPSDYIRSAGPIDVSNGPDALVKRIRDGVGRPFVLLNFGQRTDRYDQLLDKIGSRVRVAAEIYRASASTAFELRRVLFPEKQFPVGGLVLVAPGESLTVKALPATIVARQPDAAARQVQRLTIEWQRRWCPSIEVRRALADFERAGLGGAGDEEAALQLASSVESRLNDEIENRKRAENERDESILDLNETLVELNESRRRAAYLEKRLAEVGDYAAGLLPEDELPTDVESCAEVLELVAVYLSHVQITGDAEPTEALDEHPAASIWAKKGWQALQALQSYAEFKASGSFQGNFYSFCSNLPAEAVAFNSDKVATKESESTTANPKCRRARMFSVPNDVHSDCEVYMESHIKISKGGSPAPRIHFYDDTGGATGKVYVGYFGDHLPTAST